MMLPRVPQLVKSTDYYLLLLFHVGTNDAASKKVGRIKEDYKALVRQVRNIRAQVIFSSILLVREMGIAKSRCIMQISLALWLVPSRRF